MLGIIIAGVLMVSGVFVAGAKKDVFKNDATVPDTVYFEEAAARTALADIYRIERSHPEWREPFVKQKEGDESSKTPEPAKTYY